MRTFGLVMLVLGLAGFFYCQQQMEKYEAPPLGLSIQESWRHPQARWQLGQYAGGFVGVVGVLALMFPKGR